VLAFCGWPIDEPGFGGNLPSRRSQFSSSQGVEQIACEEDALSLPVSKAFTGEMFGATVHRVTDLCPETAASRHSPLAREKLAIQPRRAWCTDLLLKGEVRPGRKGEPLPALGILIGTRLDEELVQSNDLATAPICMLVRTRLIIGANVATYACVSSGSGRPAAR